MKKIDWAKKLTSRKLWMAIVGVVIGLAMAFGVNGTEIENIIGMLSGAITAVGSVLGFISGEAQVDAAAAKSSELAGLFAEKTETKADSEEQ